MLIGHNEGGNLAWRKALRSMNNGACVEVAATSGMIIVRDSMDPQGPIMRYTVNSWAPFVAAARKGGFDTLR